MKIPFINLALQYQTYKHEIDSAIAQVLDHGKYIMGPEVSNMEEGLASYCGAKHCISVASGTEALLISLMALDIGPGDEVITSPFTFGATVEVVALLGATPVFVDIEEATCNIDHTKIEAAITERTKVVIPVSLYGQPADMASINAIASRHGLTVVEDAAQSFGSSVSGEKSCNLSEIGCTSFFPSKPMGCYGDGGAIFTSNDDLAAKIRMLRVHGQESRYKYKYVGVGGRMDTLQCAVVAAKLQHFPSEVQKRIEIGAKYDSAFDQLGLRRITVREPGMSIYGQYTIFVDNRDSFISAMSEQGVPTAVHYPTLMPDQEAYRDKCVTHGSLSNAHVAADQVVSLPMSPFLTDADQEVVIESVALSLKNIATR